jgi:uncharacterized membrane protein
MTLGERLDEALEGRGRQLWLAAVLVPATALVVGAIALPDLVYDRFLWRYFWGPVVADAQNVGSVRHGGVLARPGYTLVSEAGYAYTLIVALLGLVRLLDHLDVGNSPSFFFGLVPFGFLGGALRVVEDTGAVDWPLNVLLISPIIYFTMFGATVLLLVGAIVLERRGAVERYEVPLAAAGGVAFAAVLAFLLAHGLGSTTVIWWVPVSVLALATAVWAAVWFPVDRSLPEVTAVTGGMGAVLLWAHLLDAASTSIGISYLNYGEKHPVVRMMMDAAGTIWVFVPVKAAVVLLILWSFDERFFEEYERLPYMLLVGVLAVGLGPGTRNTLRATIGV